MRGRIRGLSEAVLAAGPGVWGPLLVVIAMLALVGAAVAAAEVRGAGSQVAGAGVPEFVLGADLPPNAGVEELTATEGATGDRPALSAPPLTDAAASPTPPPAQPRPPALPPVEGDARVPLRPVEPRLLAFAGLSTWIDVYDVEQTAAQQIEIAAAAGVDTLFLQSGKYDSPEDIHHGERFGETIELAHDRGMRVVAWYVPDFVDPERDLRRARTAIGYTSPRGDRPDAFGLDIEVEDQTDVALRTERLMTLSRTLRDDVGRDYPMAAIVLPPLQLDLRPGWWPDFPYAELRPLFDVVVPMSYSSYRGTDADTTYRWSHDNIVELRARAGEPDWPVHLAGGIADDLPEVEAFLVAAADAGVVGAGLYDLATTRPDAWPLLRALRVGE
ncbi:MAG: hypothetical protein H0V93_07090 [Euzebyales bacterium]|nr:hypothetical protein [Euzebyales bacterium]